MENNHENNHTLSQSSHISAIAYSFPSHVVNKRTGLEDLLFSKCGQLQGDISSKEILRIGMFRTPEPLNIQNLQEQDHSLSLDNLLTHCNNNIWSCLKVSDATIISTL